MNHIVAFLHTGGEMVHGGWSDQQQTSFPRILVEIPDGPQYVKVGFHKSVGKVSDNLEQLAIMFELTPIDYDAKPQLMI